MLVLSRKTGEAIQIGDQVSIEILEVRGGRVRLGITAPRSVTINRAELVTSDEIEFADRPPRTAIQELGTRSAVRGRSIAVAGT